MLQWALVFHIFGVIFWIGSLLVLTNLVALDSMEVGVARERLLYAARRLLDVGGSVGAAVTVLFGIVLILADREVLRHGWLHLKIVLVLALLYYHWRLRRRIIALQDEPEMITRREFSMIHGIVSGLLFAILWLAVLKPF